MQIARAVQKIQRAESVEKFKDEVQKKLHFDKYQQSSGAELPKYIITWYGVFCFSNTCLCISQTDYAMPSTINNQQTELTQCKLTQLKKKSLAERLTNLLNTHTTTLVF
jgi:hypothetical protein